MAKVNDAKRVENTITLTDGVKRKLRFTLNAMAELEDKYGSVDEAFELLEKSNIKALRFILWTGLMSDSPELTEMDVGNLIDIQYMKELMETLGTAFGSDMPSKPEEAAGELVEAPKA
jgi:hypothetical protein